MQVQHDDHSVKIDDKLLTWRIVQSKLNLQLLFSNFDHSSGYQKFVASWNTTDKSLCLFGVVNFLFYFLWLLRMYIFSWNFILPWFEHPFGSDTNSWTKILDSLAILCLFFAFFIFMFRAQDKFRRLQFNICAYIEILEPWQFCFELIYCLLFNLFTSLQFYAAVSSTACDVLDIGCNPLETCQNLPMFSILVVFLSPFVFYFIRGSSGNLIYMFISWIIPLIVLSKTVSKYCVSGSMDQLPVLLLLSGVGLYYLELRSRQWFLLRTMGRGVVREIIEYEHSISLSTQLSTELREIVSNTAHDMKSPCTAMQLGLVTMKEIVNPLIHTESELAVFKADSKNLLQNLNSTLAFMIMTNNRSMDFAKINKGLKLVPALSSTEILADVMWAMRCVNWDTESVAQLDPASTGLALVGMTEKSWLRDNLLCLIANAYKFTQDRDTAVIRINKFSVGGREWIEVRVTDTGTTHPDLDSFFDAPTLNKRKDVGGRGLGLYCLACRVTLLKGAFGAERRKDSSPGTVVWFRIPFHDQSKVTTKPVRAPQRRNSFRRNSRHYAEVPVGGEAPLEEVKKAVFVTPVPEPVPVVELRPLSTALVIDDSILILKMSALVLQQCACVVEKANNGQAGLEIMKERKFDLVIMDVQMPILSGTEATKRLRKWESENRPDYRQLVIGVSANSEGVMKSVCIEAGMDYFTMKPFNMETIRSIYNESQSRVKKKKVVRPGRAAPR